MKKTDRQQKIFKDAHFYSGLSLLLLISITPVLLLCSCRSGEPDCAAAQVSPSKAAPVKSDILTGRWYGYREEQWGQKSEMLIEISPTTQGRYRIDVYDSAEEFSPVVLETGCTLTDTNVVIVDSSEMIDSGRGVIGDGLFKGNYQGSESGKFVLHRAMEKSKVSLAGKWQGYRSNDWGGEEPVFVNAVDLGSGNYRLEVLESFNPGSEMLFSLDGSVNSFGQLSFAGDNPIWSGTGKGFCGKDVFSGTYDGNEYGRFLLNRVKP